MAELDSRKGSGQGVCYPFRAKSRIMAKQNKKDNAVKTAEETALENLSPVAPEGMIAITVFVPKKYVVNVFQAGSAIAIPWLDLCAAGLRRIILYGIGRYLRDGAQQTYEKDKKGNVIETKAGKKAKAKAHAETRLASLISGEIRTGGGGGSKLSLTVKHLHPIVFRWAKETLGIKVKNLPKLGTTEEEAKAVCDTLEGCPFESLLKSAKAMAEIEESAHLVADVDVDGEDAA